MSDTTNNYELKEYVLGSGHLHFAELTERPTDWETFIKDFFASQTNLLGRIKGGASVEYTTEKTEDEDDLGYIVIEDVKKEKIILKSGMMTWNGYTLEAICATARVSTNETTNITTVKLGGLGNKNNKVYVIGFEHYSKKLQVLIVGKNNEGFTFSFEQDKATVIDVQFRAEALDDEGTLLIMRDLRKATTQPASVGTGDTVNGTGGGIKEPSDDEEI